jgi:CHAT domain-containing protein
MCRMCCSIFLLLVSCIFTYAQTSWQSVADSYIKLQLKGDPNFEAYEKLDQLYEILSTDFKKGNQDISLTWLLAAYEAEKNNGVFSGYYDNVVKALMNKPIDKALFLMDCATANRGHVQALTQMKEALELLKTAHQDTSFIYVQAQEDYSLALLGRNKFREAESLLINTLALAETTLGKENGFYQNLLNDMADMYIQMGNPERAVQYRESAARVETDLLGINQPYHEVFSGWLPYPEEAEVKPYLDLFHTAGLFVYGNVPNPYRKMYGYQLYKEALAAIAANEKNQGQYFATATLLKATAALDQFNTKLTIDDFKTAVNYFQNQPSGTNNLMSYCQSLNFLGCAYYAGKDFDAAANTFEKMLTPLKKNITAYGMWGKKINHNVILTYEKARNREKVRSMLTLFSSPSEATMAEADSKEYFIKYGDILFSYGDYIGADVIYSRSYRQFWGELEIKHRREQERKAKEGDSADETDSPIFMDESNTVMDIGTSEVGNIIHPFKPYGDTYRRLVFKLAQTTFLLGKYEEASKYVTEYINEFYTNIENAHFNLNRGSDLYEAYRLRSQLFPAYDLFQNIVLMDTVSSTEQRNENTMRAYGHILDSKANLQYEYRHMRTAIETGSDVALKNKYQQYLVLRDALARTRLSPEGKDREIDSLTIAIDTIKSALSSRTALLTSPGKKFVFWNDVRKVLKRNEAAIEIKQFKRYVKGQWTNDIVYAAYIITPVSAAPKVVFFRNGAFLEGRGLKQYQNRIKAKMEDTASYALYWKPIQNEISGMWKVYLSTDGVYNQINVHTLYNPSRKKFLLDDLKVYQVVSTKDLYEVKNFRTKVRSALLMGRPAYYIKDTKGMKNADSFAADSLRAITRAQIASGAISDLPGTEKEVSAIDKLLKSKGVTTQYYVGPQSSEEVFKKSRAEVLHIATHGFWFKETDAALQADAMFNSGLLFSGVKNYYEGGNQDKQDDGILTAYEVQGMNLDSTRLVILSACETALGDVEAGEGVYGLQRAFRIAGVDKMIMSLWKVDDEATQQLFTTFYKYWLMNPSDVNEAFEKTLQEMKTRYPHPFYWGAFVLID